MINANQCIPDACLLSSNYCQAQRQRICLTKANELQFSYKEMKPPSLRPFLPQPALRRRRIPASRCYAVQAPGAPTLEVFNRKVKHLQKERAAQNVEESRKVDFLKDEVASRLCERLLVRSLISSPPTRSTPSAQLLKNCFPGHQAPLPPRPRPRRQQLQHSPRPHNAQSRSRPFQTLLPTSLNSNIPLNLRRNLSLAPKPRLRTPLQ